MRSIFTGSALILCLFLASLSSLAQPVWDSSTPDVRSEVRGLGLRVNLDQKATVYYVVYLTTVNDPGSGALTATQIKNNTGPASGNVASGSFVFGDASYCRFAPPLCNAVDGDVSTTRVYSINLTTAQPYRIYFTAESIATPGSFAPVVDLVDNIFTSNRCFKVGSTTQGPDAGKNFVAITDRCSPSSYLLEVFYTGVDYSSTSIVEAIINFGEAGATGAAYTLTLQNSPLGGTEHNKEFRRYYASIVHEYDYSAGDDPDSNPPGSGCTFHIDINLGTCTTQTEQDLDATVWDDPGTVRGEQDVNPDGPDATDEEYEVCEMDRTAINLVDASEFNCTVVEETRQAVPLPSSPNYEARWVQWVYGAAGSDVTTGAASDEKVTINGEDFDLSDFPIYGPIEYVPASVTDPFSLAYPIQMPTTATPGQRFNIEMRSWNTCRPYDADISDTDGLNPVGGIFDVGDNNNNKWFSATGTYPGNGTAFADASESPVVFTKEIVIIDAPDPPVVPDRDVCFTDDASTLDELSVSAPLVGFTYRWWSDAALTNEVEDGTTFNPNNTQAPNGARTHFWVTVESSGTGNCRSQPTEVRLTKRLTLPQPNAITVNGNTANNDLCPSTSYTFGGPTAPGNITIVDAIDGNFTLTTNYQWTVPAGWTITSPQGSETITATSPATAAASANISVVRQYTDATSTPPAAVFCPGTSRTKSVTVRAAPTALISPDPAFLCQGNTLQLDGNPILAFGTIASHTWTGNSSILDDATIQQPTVEAATLSSTYNLTYTVVAQFDPDITCSGTDNITVTVNPTPPKPTITPSGPTTFCFGDDVTLSSSNITATSYQWYKDNVLIVGATAQTIFIDDVSESGDYTVRTIGIAPTNCNSEESDPVTVTVNALPAAANPTGGGAVCSGNPAPNIEWVISSGTPPFNIIYSVTHSGGTPIPDVIVNGYVPPEGTAPYTFTITDPNPPVDFGIPAGSFTYQMISLEDNNGCFATSLGLTEEVTIGGSAAVVDEAFSITPEAACDDGGSTINPVLDFSIDLTNTGFTLFYRVNGSALRPKTFDTDASGDPTGAGTPITFSDAELDAVGAHTITIVSILSAAGCQTTVNDPLTFTVNPLPPDPINPVGAVACSTDPTGATISVDDPGVGNLILWFEDASLSIPAGGTTGGVRQETFTPTSNGTFTYYAVVQSETVPTLCLSENAVAVIHTQDIPPSPAADFPDFATCDATAVLTATPADNGGTGTWTMGGTLYYETFSSAENNFGITGPNPHATNFIHPDGKWSVTLPANNVFTAATSWVKVDNGRFSARDVNTTDIVWESEILNLTGSVDVSAQMGEFGVQATGDYIAIFYKVNGIETMFGNITDDAPLDGVLQTFTATGIGAAGNTFQIVMRARNNGLADEHWMDNVIITSAGTSVPVIDNINDPSSGVSNLQVGANTFTWTISSALEECDATDDLVVITRHPLPDALDPTPELCEDLLNPTEATVTAAYLASAVIMDGVTGIVGSANRTVLFFTDPARTIAVPDPYLVSNGEIIYTRVTRTDLVPNCENEGIITFTVNPLPDAIPQDATNPETVYCERFPVGSGLADDVDLTLLEDNVTNGAGSRTVAWFQSDMTTPVATPGDIDGVVDGQTFFALVENTVTNCQKFAQVEISVNPLPLDNPIETPDGTTPATYTICTGTTTLLFQVDRDLNPGSTYIWDIPAQFLTFGGGGVNDFYVLLEFPSQVASPGLPISVTEISSDGCTGNTNTMLIIVDDAPPAPIITGDDNVCINEQSVTYNISAPVGTSVYTWNVPGTLGSIVSGQGTDEIIVNISTTSGNISVVETNLGGCTSPPAAPLNVTVNPKPSMTSATTAEICSGEVVSSALNFTSDLDPATVFEWEVINKIGSVVGASVGNTGIGDISQILTNTSALIGQVIYEVTPMIDIDPGAGTEFCPGLPAQTVIVSVHPEPLGQNDAITICSSNILNYDIQTENIDDIGNGLESLFTYTVVSSNQGSVPAEADRLVASDDAITHTYVNTTAANVTITYTITAYYDNGAPFNCEGSTFNLVVTVRPQPVLLATLDATQCSDIPSGIILNTLGTSVAAASYNITNINANGLTASAGGPVTGTGFAANVISNDAWTNKSSASVDVEYTIVPVSAVGCEGDPVVVTLTVDPEPVLLSTLSTSQCSDLPSGIILNTLGSSVAAASYNITNINANGLTASAGAPVTGTGFVANEISDDAWTNTGNTAVSVAYTIVPVSADGCEGDPVIVTLTVNPEPVVANGLDKSVCSDLAIGLVMNTNGTSISAASYNIISRTIDPSLTPVSVAAVANGVAANYLSGDIFRNVTSGPLTVTYEVIPVGTINGCLGDLKTIVVTIDPEPVLLSTLDDTQCSDIPSGIILSTEVASVAAGTYNIVSIVSNGLAASAGAPLAGTGFDANVIADDAWTNTGMLPVNVVYNIVPVSADGCAGNPVIVTLAVDPEPVLSSTLSTTRCSDVASGITLSTLGSSVAAVTYNITGINANGLTASAGAPAAGTGLAANVIADDAWTNTGNTSVVVEYTIIPVSASGCEGDPRVVTLTVAPEPVLSALLDVTQCSDVASGIMLNSNGLSIPAITYNITAINSNGLAASAGAPALGTGLAANVLANDAWTNTTSVSVNVEYTIVPVGPSGCLGDPVVVIFTVDPEPVLSALLDAAQCSDIASGIILNTDGLSVGAASYNITSINANGLVASAGVPSIGSGFAANVIANDAWTNTGSVPVDVEYTVVPVSADGCLGNTVAVILTVNPEPVVSPSLNTTQCSDIPSGIVLNTNGSSVAAVTYNITAINAPGLVASTGAPAPGTGFNANVIANDAWTNTTAFSVNVEYTIVPVSADGCLGNPLVVIFTVAPEPVLSPLLDVSQCSDTPSNIVLATNGTSVGATTYNITSIVSNGLSASAGSPATGNGLAAGVIANDAWTNTGMASVNVVYTVVPVSASGCLGDAVLVTLTVDPEPVVANGLNDAICSNQAIGLVLNTNGTSVAAANYNIISRTVAGALNIINTQPVPFSGVADNYLAGDIFRNTTNAPLNVVYVIEPVGAINGCAGDQKTITITIDPEPVGQNDTDLACNVPLSYNIQTENINNFGNGLNSQFAYTVSSSDQSNVPAGPDRVTASALPITDSYVNSTGVDVFITYTITPISTSGGCAGDPFTYIVTVRSRPVGADYTHTPDVCSGVPLNIDPQTPGITNGVVSTFTWTALYAPGLSGGAPSGTGNITGTLTNTGATPLNAIFTVTPTAGPCDGPSFDITVVIDPQPVTDPSLATRTICSDTETGILLNTNGVSVGANSWDVDVQSISSNLTPHGTNAADPGLSQPAGYIATDQFTNHSFTPGTVVYKVTPIGPPATFCRGVDTFITVTVDPEPVMNPALAATTIVCSDEVINVALSTNGASVAALSYIYSDLQNPPGTSIPISVGNAIIDPIETGAGDRAATVIQNDRYNNITGAALDRFYLIKPKSAAGCLGDIINIPVQILPEPDFTLTAAPPVCSDASIDLELAQAGATVIDEYHITSITWDIPPSAPVPGLLPGGANQATGSIVSGPNFTIQDTYTNGTNVALKAYYRVVPIAALVSGKQCIGDEKIEEVDVLPSPIVLDNLDEIVCSNTAGGVVLNTKPTSAAAQSYQIDPITTDPKFGLLTIQVFDATTRVEDGASSNEIQADRFINPTNDTIKVRYKIRANTNTGGSGCYGPEEIVVVTIEPEIVANVTSTPQICSNGTAEIILASPTNPSAGDVTFNFTASPSAAGSVSGHFPGSNLGAGIYEQILSNSSNNPVDVTYTVTPRANSAAGGSICVGDPVTTVVSVEPKPRLTITPATLTVCEGVPLGIDFNTTSRPSTGEASVFFQLTGVEDPNTLAAPANVSGFETTYPANYNSGTNVLNDILVNTALEQQSLRYSFTPSFDITSDICTGDEVSINVTVSPRPTLLPFTVDPHCSAEPFSVDYSASVTESDLSSTLATWSFAYSSPGPGLSGASNGAGFELSQVVFNKTTDPATVTYSIKAKSFNCESNTIQVPVQIYPVPKIVDVPNSVNVCDDGTLAVPLNSNATGTLFTWIVDDESQPELTGASDQLTPANGPISYLVSNSGTSLGNYTFEITPQLSTSVPGKVCVGDPKQMIVNVAPPVDGRILTSSGTNESFVCEGSRETILLEFDGLALFEAVYREGLNTITLTGQGPAKQIQITPTATTTFELVSVKDLFGCETTINETVTVNVDDTDATFAIVGPAEACSPHQVSFEHDQQEGVIYTWKWFDGPDSTAYTATTDELNKIIKHTFENSSPLTVAKYKVFLETKLADTRYPECLKTSFQEVRVSPNINVGVFPDATEICSGETVAFTNTSRGPSSHRWFYREQGTTQENDVRTTISPSFQLVNNTTQNPIVYEVVYDADNGTCPASVAIPISVYRGIDAAFDEGVIPPYVAGSATVTFTNTSTPLESSQFTYEWTFGGNSSPEEFSGTDAIIPVTYTLPGLKEVTLTVTNTVANASSLTCSDTFSKTIEILLPPLIAAFNASPLAGCFPVDIEITENTSTGDVYKWQVIDQSGNIAATALSPNPIFRIVNPGTYDIFLEASSSVTGQTAFAQKTGIEIFDNPIASLEARPSTLFIPDTELITFNFSTGANFYQWDFDDGTISQDFEPKHFYSLEGTYEVTLVAGNDHGERDIDGDGIMDGNVICYDTVKRQVIAKQGGLTKIPNAFTPNANGPGGGGDPGNGSFNDVFLPITKGVAREDGSFVMQIYDRWGTLMFESRNQNQGWNGYDRNGNLVPAGVYVFKLDLRLADGQRITQVGDVTVIR